MIIFLASESISIDKIPLKVIMTTLIYHFLAKIAINVGKVQWLILIAKHELNNFTLLHFLNS